MKIELARAKSRHLLPGCTSYTSHHDRWRHYVQLALPEPPADENLALLRDALLAPPPLP